MRYQTILVPLDGSDLGQRALDAALPLAKRFRSRVILLSAFDFRSGLPGMVYVDASKLSEARLQLEREGRSLLEAALEEAHDRFLTEGIETLTAIESGDPTEVILGRVLKDDVDLIVMASHGRRGMPRFFLGSVTDRVLRAAPCPVLVVRPEDEG